MNLIRILGTDFVIRGNEFTDVVPTERVSYGIHMRFVNNFRWGGGVKGLGPY